MISPFFPLQSCKGLIQQIQAKWKTSEPDWLQDGPVTFCGAEIALQERGYVLTQVSYIRELMQRYGVEGSAQVPISKWVEPEPDVSPDPGLIKEAQGITGALLWVSTRSRPDISYAVSRMGQQATKSPDLSISIGKQVLQYLGSTLQVGIEYLFDTGPYFSGHGQLAVPRQNKVLEVYSDASHSPAGGRSVQSVFIVWRGSPLVWESSRQSFTTLSSAEAELVGMTHAIQLSESVQPLVDELLSDDSTIALLADNSAAVRAFDSAPSGWRNRHLRMRAVAGRERIEAEQLTVSHLPGEYQVADLGTKPLARSRILQLLALINIRDQTGLDKVVRAARVLSRFHFSELSPEAVAGLALVALLPRVKGQPDNEGYGEEFGWMFWIVGVVCTVACLLVGGWWVLGIPGGSSSTLEFSGGSGAGGVLGTEIGSPSLEPGAPDLSEGEGVDGRGVPPVALERGNSSLPEVPEDGPASDPSEPSDFTEEEWYEANRKLREREQFTGLTFVQRARLRRQLLAGDVIDPPTLQQRYGPLPAWYAGIEPSSGEGSTQAAEVSAGGSRQPRVGSQVVSDFISRHGDLLIALLGVQTRTWGILQRVAKALSKNVVLNLAAQVSNTGVTQSEFEEQEWEVELQAVPGPEGIQWRPVRVGAMPRGSSELSAHADSSVQIEGSSELPVHADSRVQIEGSSELPVHADSRVQIGGSSELSVQADSSVQIGGSSELSVQADSSVQIGGSSELHGPSDLGVQTSGTSGRSPSEGFGAGPSGRNVVGIGYPVGGGTSDLTYIEEAVAERDHQTGGSSGSAGPGGLEGAPNRARAFIAGVSEGCGEDLSEDLQPAEFGVSGSSGSHGLQASGWGGVYEDCLQDEDPAEFPIVGSWLRMHFLAHLVTVVGETLLTMFEERGIEWFLLRQTSQMIRIVVAGSVVDRLRRGPYGVMFSGPQWLEAVNEYLRTGYPVDERAYAEGLSPEEGSGQAVTLPRFPYIEWPPGIEIHYLWRVFSDEGYLVLSCLGTRVCEWAYLRATAREFRSSVLYGLIRWLRETGVQRISTTTAAAEAAEEFLRSGVRNYPFGEPEQAVGEPRFRLEPEAREVFDSSSSSSEEDVASTEEAVSTAEPSVVSVTSRSEGSPDVVNHGGLSPSATLPQVVAPEVSQTFSTAGEGVLLCTYGDDAFEILLQGWPLEPVQVVVQGLESGRIYGSSAVALGPDPLGGVGSGVAEDGDCLGLLVGLLVGLLGRVQVALMFWLRVLVCLWLLVGTVRGDEGVVSEVEVVREQALQICPRAEDVEVSVDTAGVDCDGSTLWVICQTCGVVLLWELVRACLCRCCRCGRSIETVGVQTVPFGVVPLPLSDDIPRRAQILFCLWRAGYRPDTECYPEGVQIELDGLIGAWLCQLEDGEVSEASSG